MSSISNKMEQDHSDECGQSINKPSYLRDNCLYSFFREKSTIGYRLPSLSNGLPQKAKCSEPKLKKNAAQLNSFQTHFKNQQLVRVSNQKSFAKTELVQGKGGNINDSVSVRSWKNVKQSRHVHKGENIDVTGTTHLCKGGQTGGCIDSDDEQIIIKMNDEDNMRIYKPENEKEIGDRNNSAEWVDDGNGPGTTLRSQTGMGIQPSHRDTDNRCNNGGQHSKISPGHGYGIYSSIRAKPVGRDFAVERLGSPETPCPVTCESTDSAPRTVLSTEGSSPGLFYSYNAMHWHKEYLRYAKGRKRKHHPLWKYGHVHNHFTGLKSLPPIQTKTDIISDERNAGNKEQDIELVLGVIKAPLITNKDIKKQEHIQYPRKQNVYHLKDKVRLQKGVQTYVLKTLDTRGLVPPSTPASRDDLRDFRSKGDHHTLWRSNSKLWGNCLEMNGIGNMENNSRPSPYQRSMSEDGFCRDSSDKECFTPDSVDFGDNVIGSIVKSAQIRITITDKNNRSKSGHNDCHGGLE